MIVGLGASPRTTHRGCYRLAPSFPLLAQGSSPHSPTAVHIQTPHPASTTLTLRCHQSTVVSKTRAPEGHPVPKGLEPKHHHSQGPQPPSMGPTSTPFGGPQCRGRKTPSNRYRRWYSNTCVEDFLAVYQSLVSHTSQQLLDFYLYNLQIYLPGQSD